MNEILLVFIVGFTACWIQSVNQFPRSLNPAFLCILEYVHTYVHVIDVDVKYVMGNFYII